VLFILRYVKKSSPMPTSLPIDDTLIGEAVRLGRFKTKKATVIAALGDANLAY
jgi:Arc/MetJ family transcription regulator